LQAGINCTLECEYDSEGFKSKNLNYDH
jgi:hypothetical protein